MPLSLPNACWNTELFIPIISIARDLFPEFVRVVGRGVEGQKGRAGCAPTLVLSSASQPEGFALAILFTIARTERDTLVSV